MQFENEDEYRLPWGRLSTSTMIIILFSPATTANVLFTDFQTVCFAVKSILSLSGQSGRLRFSDSIDPGTPAVPIAQQLRHRDT